MSANFQNISSETHEKSVVLMLDGHRVRLNFLPEPREDAMDCVKTLLIRSLCDANVKKQ